MWLRVLTFKAQLITVVVQNFEIHQIRNAMLVEMTDCYDLDWGPLSMYLHKKLSVLEIDKEFLFSVYIW